LPLLRISELLLGDFMKCKEPPGPREGSEFGYDPADAMKGMVRALFDRSERDGELKPIGVAAGLPKITDVKRCLINASADIRADPPEELAFQHTVLCQTSLPSREQPPDVLSWKKQQGRAVLLIEAGKAWHPQLQDFVQLPLPYGPKARLILMHLNSEAMKRQSPVIPVEDSMTAFVTQVQGRAPTGPEITRFKKQLSALSAATVRMAITSGDLAMQLDTKIVGAFDLWFPRDNGQRVLWPSTLRLSLDYYDSLSRHAVPLDERAIAALQNSAMALDVYCWLAQRLWRISGTAPQFVPWAALYEQFGQGYAQLRQFRAFFKRQLTHVKTVYGDARFDVDDRKGMYLWQSPPPLPKRLVALPGGKTLDLKAEPQE
jgi:hypothetical protein